MRNGIFIIGLLAAGLVHAKEQTMTLNFIDQDITKTIQQYAKITGQKFIVDPGVKGKITIFNPQPVTPEEAFDQLSTALALNSYGITKRGDIMVVRQARNLQRDLIETGTELPSVKPERQYTWIVNMKYISAEAVNRDLRLLTSKDGELSVFPPRNQLIMTDWTPNLVRVSEILKELDKPGTSAAATKTKEAKSKSE